ncbi:PREDICTED: transcription factor 21-like [Branchiostoma belcheri]|uniref:Transcription factor 21-like n=1 Tax=Branchiostoma belcheri TaxID=7741 RepID=A0A6P4YT25_BRABE|nr:PREDICTED: transcription factor 21-like [Branchiostoma belcheri]
MSTGTPSDTEELNDTAAELIETDQESTTADNVETSSPGQGAASPENRARRRRRKRASWGEKDAKPKPEQRNAANARERSRMRTMSKAFVTLKTTLPWVPPDTKLSKLDTLRLAASYIAHLRQVLQQDKVENNSLHPVNLTWPFAINSKMQDSRELQRPASTGSTRTETLR